MDFGWILGAKLESENGQVGPKSRLGPKYSNFLKDSLGVKKNDWEKLHFWSHLGPDLAKTIHGGTNAQSPWIANWQELTETYMWSITAAPCGAGGAGSNAHAHELRHRALGEIAETLGMNE